MLESKFSLLVQGTLGKISESKVKLLVHFSCKVIVPEVRGIEPKVRLLFNVKVKKVK